MSNKESRLFLLRCALFGPVAADDEEMGPVAKTAVFAQWFHAGLDLHYARWRGGEVDIVALDRRQSPDRCVEVKWSDRHVRNPGILNGLREFARRHPRAVLHATTRTDAGNAEPWSDGLQVSCTPTSLYCYLVGQAAIRDPSATAFRAAGAREGDLSRYLERAPDAPPGPGDELPG